MKVYHLRLCELENAKFCKGESKLHLSDNLGRNVKGNSKKLMNLIFW